MSTEKDYKEEYIPGYFALVEYAEGGSRVIYHEKGNYENRRKEFHGDIVNGVMEGTMEWTDDDTDVFIIKSKGGNRVTFYKQKVGAMTTRERDAIVDIIVLYDSVDKKLKDYINKTYYNENPI